MTAPAAAISDLIAEAATYLASFSGRGLDQVHAGLDRWRTGSVGAPSARANTVIDAHLGPALAAVDRYRLAAAIAAAAPHLPWVTYDLYDRTQIGEAFAMGHAFAPLIGEAGPVPAEDFELGLFVIAPHVFYRDHAHAAPELYAPLTGPNGWRFAPDDPLEWKPAHVPVWNQPFRPHAIKAGAKPFLCFYVWTADVNEPASVIPAHDWAKFES